MTAPPDDPPRSDALEAGCRTALACSHYAVRALHAECSSAAEAEPAAAQQASFECLLRLASTPWSRERIALDLESQLESAAAHAGDPARMLAAALRRTRRRVLLGLIARDAAGVAPLAEVTAAMTALAEIAVRRALRVHATELAARHGIPCDADGGPQDLLVVAMGKAGGVELNVSSDLDLVFVYDEEGQTGVPDAGVGAAGSAAGGPLAAASAAGGGADSLTNQEFFERLGRRLIATLAELTADGIVFRVDMRLRPNGDSGPLVVSNGMLEEYLVRQGREWERFAWLKGRVISAHVLSDAAGFAAQTAALDAIVDPFVYRKYLDFGAIAALRELHDRIRAETGRRAAARAERVLDVKLGRGGIREIEFIAQTFQVMRGGRQPQLRQRGTVATLAALARLGLMPDSTAARLAESYDWLRRLEHALQYVDDAQTHRIPAQPQAREAVARLLRLPSARAMLEHHEATSEFVASVFDAIFRSGRTDPAAPPGADSAPAGEARLRELGFERPAEALAHWQALLASPRLAAASPAARAAIERLSGHALEAIATVARQGTGTGGASADEILLRWIRLIEVIARRSTYLSLLDEYPHALERVVRLLGAGSWATEYLLRHPIVLDELIDERAAGARNGSLDTLAGADWPRWAAGIETQLRAAEEAAGSDPERPLNLLRDAHHAQVFRLLIADLNGHLSVERLADHLSALADAVLDLALRSAWRAWCASDAARGARDEGVESPPPPFAVIGYGKLGGKELGYASDLDLIFVYDDPQPDAAAMYAQIARRLVACLTTPTPSGILFEIDLRLRPNGNAGLLVTQIEAFERYQRNADGHGAWVWEHQALTRARWCAGDSRLGARFESLRREVLARAREPAPLAAEVVAMRRRMLDGHPNRSSRFDLKHDRGGMVDVEFVVQFLVLAHSHRHPELLDGLGNIRLLGIAAELGLLEAPLADASADAYRHYRRLQHALRLNGAPVARVAHEEVRTQIDTVLLLWRRVLGSDEPRPPKPGAG